MSYHREGLWVMESREIPVSLAAWKIFPSTSMLTALVHSSNRAYFGLTRTKETVFILAIHPVSNYETGHVEKIICMCKVTRSATLILDKTVVLPKCLKKADISLSEAWRGKVYDLYCNQPPEGI